MTVIQPNNIISIYKYLIFAFEILIMKHGIIFVAWNSMRNLMWNKKEKENIPKI